ncbi:MAG: nucleoside-diphosphate kinase [Peptococcaceae bacterium]|jgi:nucleoside-diphosphate kinase|nr:nucleoside-diphosphate kinase [Peptococcaceae bacterium]MDH7523703.1 nucleoside-diphosphate kinase [Peptococcaceae bacterium]
MERTFVMVKPDGVQRGLVARVLGAIEARGYKLIGLKMMSISPRLAAEHYAEHAGKPFYDSLLEHITSGPVAAMVWEGKGVVSGVRAIMGATNPLEAKPGSLRGDYAVSIDRNLVHGSDSEESAEREIRLFFKPEELVSYDRDLDKWIW